MAYVSQTGVVELNRGDSVTLDVLVNLGTRIEPNIYIMQENDCVYFGLMEVNQPFEFAILKKKITSDRQTDNGAVQIELDPDDTLCLLPGKYYYQVKLAIQPNTVHTIIDKAQFFILE